MNFVKNQNQPISVVYIDKKRKNSSVLKYLFLIFTIGVLVSSVLIFIFFIFNDKNFDFDAKVLTKNFNLFGEQKEENTPNNNVQDRKYNEYTLSRFSNEEIDRLGILDIPIGFSVQYEYKGIKFVRTPRKSFTYQQIGLLKYFIDMTPAKLLNPGPAAIITFDKGEISPRHNLSQDTIAFASGMYMFFNDISFNSIKNDHFVDNAFATFVHELMHISQFNYVFDEFGYEDALKLVEKKGYSWVDLVSESALTRSFAESTEWEYDPQRGYFLNSKENVLTTDYGKTSIYEDIADTVAAVVTTRFDLISENRIIWTLNYLQENSDSIKMKKLPVFPNSKLVNLEGANFIDTIKQEYNSKYDYVSVSTFYYDKEKSINDVVSFFENEFNDRYWTVIKPLYKTNTNSVITYEGEFSTGVRNSYIRIYTYDYVGTGYNISLKGTVVVFICGFKFN
ncbi:MAG: hypothetical protein N3A71_02270 [Candidatus Dojkabacteria bacterium]|nr:hypothetical protein [Candidatus Dojkabacteria bacterium]